MISIEHVSKSFGKTEVLRDISLQLTEGEIYGLIGYNGVGKTTLMKMISGIYRPDTGAILMDGEPIYENAAMKKQCFFMTEEATYFSQASLLQMRKFYSGYYENWSDQTFYGLIRLFGVDPDMKISRFSKGMQRQASLALAFATRSKCLFLDEAFDGLDFTMRRMMREMLIYYAHETNAILVVSSHNLKELEDLADHIAMLSEGDLVFNDSTQHMRERFCACHFRTSEKIDPENLNAAMLEREDDGWLCILEMEASEARWWLEKFGAQDIHIRPIRLEEFFRIERKVQNVEWKEIFDREECGTFSRET